LQTSWQDTIWLGTVGKRNEVLEVITDLRM